MLKNNLLFVLFFGISFAKAQKIDSIYLNLYTDSLKKGTYNYINVDGLLSNGRYLPLDSTHLIFTSSAGKFFGNTLWIDRNYTGEKIFIKATLRKNPAISKEMFIWIKTVENNEHLKTAEEIIKEIENQSGTRSKRKKN